MDSHEIPWDCYGLPWDCHGLYWDCHTLSLNFMTAMALPLGAWPCLRFPWSTMAIPWTNLEIYRTFRLFNAFDGIFMILPSSVVFLAVNAPPPESQCSHCVAPGTFQKFPLVPPPPTPPHSRPAFELLYILLFYYVFDAKHRTCIALAPGPSSNTP